MGQFKTAQAAREKYLELHPAEKLFVAAGGKGKPQASDKEAADESVPIERSPEFTVSFDADLLKLPLGIGTLPTADKKALGVVEVCTGAVSEWNIRYPDRQVRIGDRIVKVGKAVDDAEQLANALKQCNPFDIVIRVPEEFRISLSKGSDEKLGMDVQHFKTFLRVKRILDDGAVKKWNDANPASAVHPYHVIMEVNGVRGDADLMVTEVQFEKTVDLLLR
jgi:hypothetical protein